MVLERSYSSASSTTSSRRSGRRKRKRIKHTVMPLKKRPGRHEVPCDVHRVSNLDHEEMVQSACFWVAKNPVDEPERSFKEEVFVDKDEEELSDENVSYSTEEVRQSRHTEESASRADSHALEDRHYTEEKTFYGLRKGKVSDGGDVERISPLPSSRNDSRLSSVSDDSPSGASSDGHGMLVGWTSDINNSSGPECSGVTEEEPEGEKGGGEGERRPRKDLRSINDEWEESMEFSGYRRRRVEDETSSDSRSRDRRSVERRDDHRQHVVVARDVTSFESNTFETERSHNDSLDSGSKDGDFPRTREQVPQEYGSLEHGSREHGPHGSDSGGFYPGGEIQDSDRRDSDSRRSYRGTEVRESEHFGYNRRDVQETTTVEQHSFMNGRDVYPGGKAPGGYIGEPGQDRVESPILESSGYDGNYLTSAAGEPLSGVRTSTPTRRELPSSDTEVVLQNYDADGEQSSNRSLPVGHRKTTTKYYSVEDLRRSTGTSDQTADRGPNISGAPRREDVGSRADDLEESGTPVEREMRVGRESGSIESGNTSVVAIGYELNKQRPRYVTRRTGNEVDEDNKENVGPNENNGETKERVGTLSSERERLNREKWEEEVEFHGYRRHQADDKFVDSYSKSITRDQNREDLVSSEGQRGFTRDPNDREPSDGKRSGDDTGNNFDNSNDSGRFRPGDIYPAREVPDSEEYHVTNARDVYPGGKIRGGQGEGIVRAEEEEEFIAKEQTETLTSRHEHTTSTEGRWEETKEFHGYRRHQTDEDNSHLASIDSYGKSSTRAQWTSGDVGRGDERQGFEKSMEEPSFAQGEREGPIAGEQQGYGAGNNLDDVHDSGPYVPRTYEDIYPGTEIGDSEQFFPVSDGGVHLGGDGPARYGGAERRPAEEDRAREEQPESLGLRDESESAKPRGYDVDTENNNEMAWDARQRFGESRDPSSGKYDKVRSFEIGINKTTIDESQTQPEYGNFYPRDEQTRHYAPEEEGHWFVSREIPSAKKVVPVTCSPSAAGYGGPKGGFPGSTEATTKRLHTRSQRDTFRRIQTKRSEPKSADDASDVGLKMFKQRSLPRKHGHPPSSGDGKELPRKTRRSAEPESTKSDPESRERFRDIAEKRKKVKTKHATKTTETTTTMTTTTKSTEERCNKNVDELVSVFNTLEHLEKKAAPDDKGAAKLVAPRSVRKIVESGELEARLGKNGAGKVSPATSISQKLQEIENILDTVGKNNQQRSREGSRFKSDSDAHGHDWYQSSEDGRSTRSSEGYNEAAKSPDYSEVDAQNTTRERHQTREENAWIRGRDGDKPWKPEPTSEIVTKQDALPDESHLESTPDESTREPRVNGSQPARFSRSKRPWSDTDGYAPFASRDRPYYDDDRITNKSRASRDDDDDTYRAQLRKARDLSWETRRKDNESRAYSDGEVEGFKRPLFNRVITPGTPVNIRLYGLNLERTCLDRPQGVDWDLFNHWEAPVDENIARSEIQRRPGVEAMPWDKPRMGDRDIGRSVTRPSPSLKWSHPPSSKVSKEEPQSLAVLPGLKDEPDGQVPRREIKWSHPPMSKVNQDKLQKSTEMDAPQATEVAAEQQYPSRKVPPVKRPSEERPWEERPTEERPSEERPSEERPLLVGQYGEVLSDDSQEERSIEIQYVDDELPEGTEARPNIERMDISDDLLNDLPPELPQENAEMRSGAGSPDKPAFSGRKSDNNVDENTSREETSSSEKQESTTREDHTITTTRTTRTTRTTTETVVKKMKTSASESSRSDDVMQSSQHDDATSEPDGKTKDGEVTLVAHEYIEMNADTGRPVNVTMLGRVLEDTADELSSQSREDLFLHTRLKMVTENKRRSNKQAPDDVNEQLRGSETAEQDADGVDNEGELTDSEDEFYPCDDGTATISDRSPDDTTELLLIPISGMKDERNRVSESVEKMDLDDKRARAFLAEDTAGHEIFSPRTAVDEQITQTMAENPESVLDDGLLEDIFSPAAVQESELQKGRVEPIEFSPFDSMPEFQEPVAENPIESSRNPEKLEVDFGEPAVPDNVENEAKHVGSEDEKIALSQVDECITCESAPADEFVFSCDDELVFGENDVSVPTLQREPVEEITTSERRDIAYDIPDVLRVGPPSSQPSLVDETIFSPEPIARDVYIPDFQEFIPKARETHSPTLVDENICPEEKIPRDQTLQDFQEVMPEFVEPRAPILVDENISSTEKIGNEPDVLDFQEVVPEFRKPRPERIDYVSPPDEDEFNDDFRDFQEAEQEPRRNLIPVGSDVEMPTSSSQSLSAESDPAGFVNIEVVHENMGTNDDRDFDTGDVNQKTYPKATQYFEVPKRIPEPETQLQEEVSTEIRSSETITVEKTVRKNVHYISDVPIAQKEDPESPRKGVSFASPLEVREFSDGISESSSETSLQSWSVGSGDVSSEVDGSSDVSATNAARRRRNRRGNRFDNIKRSGSLVPESVVSKSTSPEPESMSAAVPVSNVPGINVPRSHVPDQKVAESPKVSDIGGAISPVVLFSKEKRARLRPEMYLLSSDDSSGAEDLGVSEMRGQAGQDDAMSEEPEAMHLSEMEAWKMEGTGKPAEEEEEITSERAKEQPEEMPAVLPDEMPAVLPDEMPAVPPEEETDELFTKDSEDTPEEEEELSQEQIDEFLEKEIQGLAKESEVSDVEETKMNGMNESMVY